MPKPYVSHMLKRLNQHSSILEWERIPSQQSVTYPWAMLMLCLLCTSHNYNVIKFCHFSYTILRFKQQQSSVLPSCFIISNAVWYEQCPVWWNLYRTPDGGSFSLENVVLLCSFSRSSTQCCKSTFLFWKVVCVFRHSDLIYIRESHKQTLYWYA